MPDATGLELIAQRVRDKLGDEAVTDTVFFRGEATLGVAPQAVRDVLAYLQTEDAEPWTALMSVHGCDYLPDEPRLGVHYQLLSRERLDRLNVKVRMGVEDPVVPSVGSPEIFSCSLLNPYISASGRGGQPGTYTSIGRNLSAPATSA